MSPTTIQELAGLALACGASDFGGSLSKSEIALAKGSARVSKAAARRIRAEIREGADPLGTAFCALRSPLERRTLGAFYTSSVILKPMMSWALAQKPGRFVDPGCGSGRFAIAAAIHKSAPQVIAVDLDPLATLLTRAALAAVGSKRALVLNANYLTVHLPKFDGRTAFVGNPPYIRHHHLNVETKKRARILAAKVGHPVSGLAGLHAIFYLATLAVHGVEGDVGSFVTSAEWLDVNYGAVIRSMFTNGLGGRSLSVFDFESVPFDDAMTTAAITTFKLGEEPSVTRIAQIVSAESFKLEVTGRDVKRTVLAAAARWSPLLYERQTEAIGDTIGTLFKISRGQVTGANSFFVMSKSASRTRGLERFCVPVVSSAKQVLKSGGVLRDDENCLVALEIPKDLNLNRFPRLAAYVAEGEKNSVHRGFVTSHRSPWWSVTFPKPPIVGTYMARQAPLFASNPDGLGLLNVVHGFHPRVPLDAEKVQRVVGILNANRESYIGRGRTYHGGLEKFEPGEMEALPLSLECT